VADLEAWLRGLQQIDISEAVTATPIAGFDEVGIKQSLTLKRPSAPLCLH
jgi:hypothetical protein